MAIGMEEPEYFPEWVIYLAAVVLLVLMLVFAHGCVDYLFSGTQAGRTT